MSDDSVPTPEPAGTLVPPDRHPPTAIGPATPDPLPSLPSEDRMATSPALVRALRRAVDAALDVADDLADVIAGAIDDLRAGRPGDRRA